MSWKLFAPYTQWTSELENQSESKSQEPEVIPETKSAKPQEAVPVVEKQQEKQPIEPAVEYKPYSMVPTYIKQLIFKMYEPQGPYVDPKVYIYHTPVEVSIDDQTKDSQDHEKNAERRQETIVSQEETSESVQKYFNEQETASQQQVQQRATAQESLSDENSKLSYQNPILKKKQYYGKYPLKEIGHIEYKKDETEAKQPQYGFVPPQQTKTAQETSLPIHESTQQENVMPSLIQQLLNLQAQIPYYVIANRINYKPKKMFIPKPISEDEKSAYTYRSKIYYMRDGEEELENKPVEKVAKDPRI